VRRTAVTASSPPALFSERPHGGRSERGERRRRTGRRPTAANGPAGREKARRAEARRQATPLRGINGPPDRTANGVDGAAPCGSRERDPLSLSFAIRLLWRGLRQRRTATANDTAPPLCRARACTAPRGLPTPTTNGGGAQVAALQRPTAVARGPWRGRPTANGYGPVVPGTAGVPPVLPLAVCRCRASPSPRRPSPPRPPTGRLRRPRSRQRAWRHS